MKPRAFLAELRAEVEAHDAVGHSLLGKMQSDPITRADFRAFGLQHYPLVRFFTRYLELLLLAAPDARDKLWLAKVLVDEYGEGSRGLDHPTLYRSFLRATGAKPGDESHARLHPVVSGFIQDHIQLVTDEPFLVGLGAVGPGHEWAIPRMFALVLVGLRRAGFDKSEIEYFELHVEQDKDHGAWLEEALVRHAGDARGQQLIRRGALASLALREQLWWGIADKMSAQRLRERNPGLVPSSAGSEGDQATLAELEVRHRLPQLETDPRELALEERSRS